MKRTEAVSSQAILHRQKKVEQGIYSLTTQSSWMMLFQDFGHSKSFYFMSVKAQL